jgi:hypothetical protein
MAASFRKKYRQKETAEFLEVAETTLESWRFYGKGPPYLKIGGKVFYLESDLIAFMEAGRVLPAEPAPRRSRIEGAGTMATAQAS